MQIARDQDRNGRSTSGNLPAPRILWLETVCIAAVIFLQFGPGPWRVVSAFLLIGWALTGAHGIVQSLSLSILVVGANPALAAPEPKIVVLKWVLILACLVRIVLFGGQRAHKRPAWVLSFGVFVVVTSVLAVLVSPDKDLSAFKLMSFAAGVLAALLGFAYDTRPAQYWLNWFFTVHVVVASLSIPLLFLSAGYVRNGWSFQGILSHPQAFGVYMAFWGVYLIAYMLTSKRVSLFLLLVTCLTAYLIVESHCRTAMLAMTASVVISAVTAFTRRDGSNCRNPSTVARLCSVVLITVVLLAYNTLGLSATLKDLGIKKYAGSGDTITDLLTGSFESSRGEQVRDSLDNIADHPLFGVGFGVAPDGIEQVVERDPILGIPVSASLEQGFLPLGVLSQIGIIGALVLGAFLFKLAAPLVKFAPVPVLAMFSTALLVNLGEMIFFATGGLGLEMWLILGLCHEYAVCEGRSLGGRAPHAPWRSVLIGVWRKGVRYAR